MPLAPVTALTRKLKWDDFVKDDRAAPTPGVIATSAGTHTDMGIGGLSVQPVANSKPVKYKLDREPTVNVTFMADSWVAKYVFTWDQDKQDALLDHEQIHYLISAVSGRDCLEVLKKLQQKSYDDTATAISEVTAAQSILDVQDIQNKYDADTKGQPSSYTAEQLKWATAVRASLTANTPLRPALELAGLIPKPGATP